MFSVRARRDCGDFAAHFSGLFGYEGRRIECHSTYPCTFD